MHRKPEDTQEDIFWGTVWSVAIIVILFGLTLLVWMYLSPAR